MVNTPTSNPDDRARRAAARTGSRRVQHPHQQAGSSPVNVTTALWTRSRHHKAIHVGGATRTIRAAFISIADSIACFVESMVNDPVDVDTMNLCPTGHDNQWPRSRDDHKQWLQTCVCMVTTTISGYNHGHDYEQWPQQLRQQRPRIRANG